MNRRLRLTPPKQRLAQTSGRRMRRIGLPCGREHHHAVELLAPGAPAAPQIAGDVAAETVGRAGAAVHEHPAVGELAAVVDHVIDLDQPVGIAARLHDVEALLVRREADAVRPHEIVGHHRHLAARVDPVDIRGQFRLLLVADVVAGDAVGRIGEPDRAVGMGGDVVGRVEPLAVVAVGDRGDGAVILGAADAARAVLAADQRPARSRQLPLL